ncbi:MAG: response regulator transcription factor [Nitrospirota bacterium]
MMKFLIADDHTLFREGLKRVLNETFGGAIFDEAVNGREVIKKAAEKNYDVVLLDISMPGRDGLDTLKQLKSDRPDIHVLVVSMHSEKEYAERVLRAGAFGYITKESSTDELITAVRKMAAGKKYVSSTMAERLVSHLGTNSEKLLHETLSDREFEIMCLIASGMTVKDIAVQLSLSMKTVSTHRIHILRKMEMENNSQLIHYALQNQLVT